MYLRRFIYLCVIISRLSNEDETYVGTKLGFDHLNFESRFESGNLRKVIKVSNVIQTQSVIF